MYSIGSSVLLCVIFTVFVNNFRTSSRSRKFHESIRQSCSANVSMVTNTVVYDKGSGLPPYLEQEVSASCQHVTYFGTSMKEDN